MGAAWVEAANAVGFDFRKGHRGPLLPRLSCDYGWAGDAIDANETTRWIRMLLARLKGEEEDLTFSSHGLKATPLSWTSKAGYSDRTQLVLGHHSRPLRQDSRSVCTRGPGAAAQRFCGLSAIHQGIFHPDRTKSGMIAQGASLMGSRFSLNVPGKERASPLLQVLSVHQPTVLMTMATKIVSTTKVLTIMRVTKRHRNLRELRAGRIAESDSSC